ncbi:WD40 repeat domain-containing protein [Streptomyces sp. NRRL WC-3549]|uniref:WD40 repeat domain-containing protein n=1 Tax=Streptomyces sp. NRRL WC-3549 TaxID=1463925 RepID=UPI002D21A564|nr:WD40 repeat domain-containing protein [Streptomyces sp. NRRL WC-3549]
MALFLLATTGLIGSVTFQREAERAGRRDLGRYLAAEAEDLRDQQPGLAKQLSLLAYRTNKDAGRGALLNSRRTPGVLNADETAHDLAYSADGRVLAISVREAIELRFKGGSSRIRAGVVGPVTVSRDGRTLAAVTYDESRPKTGRVRLWDISDPHRPRQTAAPRLDHAVHSLALSTDGAILYGGLYTGELRVWDLHDRAAPKPLPAPEAHSTRIDSLAVSAERDLLASMSVDGTIRLWKAAGSGRPERVAVLEGTKYERDTAANPRPLHRVAFDPRGLRLAAPVAGKNKDGLALWKLDTPAEPKRIGQPKDGATDSTAAMQCYSGIDSVAFSPVREYVVAACEGTWHVHIYAKTIIPDAILSGTSAGGRLGEGVSEPGMVLFDPAEPRKLLQATDRGVRVWYLNNSAQLGADSFLPAEPGTGGQFDYRLSGDKRLLALQGVGVNYLLDVTDMPDSFALQSLTRSPDMFTGADIALSPDGRLLADVELYDGTEDDEKGKKEQFVGVRLRSTSGGRGAPLLSTIDDLDNGVQAIAFSPTEPLLAVSDMNGWRDGNSKQPAVRIYDIADPGHPRQISRIEATSTGLEFSPDGETLLLNDSPFNDPDDPRPQAKNQLQSWDLSDPAHPEKRWGRNLPAGMSSVHVAFRPDGKVLAVYDSDGTLSLWRVEEHRLAEELSRSNLSIYGSPVAFSPDGALLALFAQKEVGADTRPEIWSVGDPKAPALHSYLPGDSGGQLYALQFDPDARFLAVVRAFAGVDLWDTDPERVIGDLCAGVGDPITRKQWEHFLPDKPYEPPCRSS